MTDVHTVVVRSGLRSGRDPAALEFYRTCPGGQLIVACQEDRVVGVSFAVSFGRTGWIGNGATDTDVRGHIPRMRLGPPVPGFHPEQIFNVFSFAVG
jgi:hypothetical protein